jgi:hypothetical protein
MLWRILLDETFLHSLLWEASRENAFMVSIPATLDWTALRFDCSIGPVILPASFWRHLPNSDMAPIIIEKTVTIRLKKGCNQIEQEEKLESPWHRKLL